MHLCKITREHSVFIEKFEDGSFFFAAKKKRPDNAAKSLKWALGEDSSQRPLIARYIKYSGRAKYEQLAKNLSK